MRGSSSYCKNPQDKFAETLSLQREAQTRAVGFLLRGLRCVIFFGEEDKEPTRVC